MADNTKSLVNTVELGRAIRRKREDAGLSLRDVADETGVSASTLSRIENGTGKPDSDNIARPHGWLNMPMEARDGQTRRRGEMRPSSIPAGGHAEHRRGAPESRPQSHAETAKAISETLPRRLHAVLNTPARHTRAQRRK